MSPTEGFQGAWSQLYEDYGHLHMISRRCEERLKDVPRLREFDMDGLNNLFILLNKFCTCLKSSPSYSTLDSMDVIRRVARIWKRGGGGGYFERVRKVQTTLTRIFIVLESVSIGMLGNWKVFSAQN